VALKLKTCLIYSYRVSYFVVRLQSDEFVRIRPKHMKDIQDWTTIENGVERVIASYKRHVKECEAGHKDKDGKWQSYSRIPKLSPVNDFSELPCVDAKCAKKECEKYAHMNCLRPAVNLFKED
jgi:hypothetical protein